MQHATNRGTQLNGA